MIAATPSSASSPHAAATVPKSRCRVRSGSILSSRASSSAATSAALPRYRSETILGLPSTQPISRRYQYGRPLITFLYRLATFRSYAKKRAQSNSGAQCHQGKRVSPGHSPESENHDHRKLGLEDAEDKAALADWRAREAAGQTSYVPHDEALRRLGLAG